MDKIKIKTEIEELTQSKHLINIRLSILRYILKYEKHPGENL